MIAENRWEAAHFIDGSVETYLDVGCNVGALVQPAHQKGVTQIFGVDINAAAVEKAKAYCKDLQNVHLQQSSADELPFETGQMNIVTACEVLEHIPEKLQMRAIGEIARVLKPGGRFVLTVPHTGMFAFLDPANVRFRLPALYQLVHRVLGGPGLEAGFTGQKHDVVWHKHFSLPELQELLQKDFEIIRVRYRGSLLVPLCDWLLFPFYRLGAGWRNRGQCEYCNGCKNGITPAISEHFLPTTY